MNNKLKARLIDLAIEEDLGNGDHTSLACIPSDAVNKAQLIVKDDGIIAGIEVAASIFRKIIPDAHLTFFLKDGDAVKHDDVAFTIEGNTQKLLQAERLILNFMQRMSGIATCTRQYVDKISDLPAKILDTRKTTPGLRLFEKEAVQMGGGKNHRMGLYDMMMLKDNHIDYAGGIEQAIAKAVAYREKYNLPIPVEIEARNMKEVDSILATGRADRIMLDNFDYATTREAVSKIDRRCATESSGGINLETVRPYAECGVDFISVGALTHQIHSLDMSLKAI